MIQFKIPFTEELIILTEAKKIDEDLEDAIMQNADQIISWCINNGLNFCYGIATTGRYWIFTKYTHKEGICFSISETFGDILVNLDSTRCLMSIDKSKYLVRN